VAPHDVFEHLAHVFDLIERDEHGVHGRRADLLTAFHELDELVDDGARLVHALVLPLDRQPVSTQANRAPEPVAERVEHAVADRSQLGGDVIRDREHLLHGPQCRRGGRPDGCDASGTKPAPTRALFLATIASGRRQREPV
jgi:hypothetical protein